jgi:acetyltransferase-like isoleucine patch superfamily enzyme
MNRSGRLRHLVQRARWYGLFAIAYRWVDAHPSVVCQWTARFRAPDRLVKIGAGTGIGHRLLVHSNVVIGRDVLIANEVAFLNKHEHVTDVPSVLVAAGEGDVSGVTTVGDDVWIGYRVTLLGPLAIGDGAIIAAGSVVLEDVPPMTIVAGVPGRVVRRRFDSPEAEVEHLRAIQRGRSSDSSSS